MATTKHTPGPWEAVTSTEKVLDTVINEFGDPICQLHNGGFNFKPDNIEANAALIAAAPDLLEALKALMPIVKHFVENKDFTFIVKAEAAIAKAENPELSK